MSDPYSGYPRDSLGVPQGVPGSGFTLPALLHWMWYGKRPGGGLNAFPGQLISAFDPRSKAGAANLLSMFAGGGKFDASPQMEGLGMHGQFEAYSPAKASAGGHLSADQQPYGLHELTLKTIHDRLFGGEVHARGPIPRQPTEALHEPPRNTEDVVQSIANKLGIHRDRVEAQMRAADQHNALVARQQNVARILHNHGFEMDPRRVAGKLAGFKSHPGGASHYFHGEDSHFITPREVHDHPEALHQLTGGHPLRANDARTLALKQMLAAHQHFNHRN